MRFILKDNLLIPSGKQEAQRIDCFSPLPISSCNPTYSYSPKLQQFLDGKKLLLDEIHIPLATIQEHYEHGYVSYGYGVTKEKKGYYCHRCGNEEEHLFHTYECARCSQSCAYCRRCIMMGRVAECTPLVRWIGPVVAHESEGTLAWSGTLSKAQQMASEKMIEALETQSSLLIWAVCGAGKTEILFQGISESLAADKRICLATPRTDVVLELTPRLQRAFPKTKIASLYGGSEDRNIHAPLTITTTHQLLRFSSAFDIVIVDEVDAFPYSMDKMLQDAVVTAKKDNAALIYLTATPTQIWQREVKKKKQNGVIIPARYHQHPLPVPQFAWCDPYEEKIPKQVMKWIEKHLHQKPILLFLPHVKMVKKMTTLLQKIDEKIEGVYAEDKERKEKVTAFRKREIPLLVTTTILERGVTIDNVQVAVLGADNRVFSESALVQIAGRAGRNKDNPSGDVIFFHRGKSDAMVLAKGQIEGMNKEGKKKGMLDG